jgi:tetratricopeptide (TPR) repeat protein
MKKDQPDLKEADAALRAGEPERCRQICRLYLDHEPGHPGAQFLTGVAALQMSDFNDACNALAFVRSIHPANRLAALYHGMALRRSGEHQQAITALSMAGDDPAVKEMSQYELAICLTQTGRPADAANVYADLLKQQPHHADAAANLSALLEQSNQVGEASRWADRALKLDDGNTVAQLTRATLDRRAGKLDEASARLTNLLLTELSPLNRSLAQNQLGQCSDRLDEYRNAYRHFSESNRILWQHHPEARPDPAGSYSLESVSALRLWLRQHPADDWSPTPADTNIQPVFLLGFPRSGTTLLDQALSAHPDIEVLEEAELLDEARQSCVDDGRLQQLHELTEAEIHAARNSYLSAREALVSNSASRRIVDKLPLNSVYIQLIHRLFPDAHIIFALRDPRDACLSCWFQSFDLVGAMPYFLDTGTTARYYDAVMGLLHEALECLPLNVHQVRYESLVTGFETEMKNLISFLGLPWDKSVLDYRDSNPGKRINTPSYQQVIQPLYTRSIGRWRHYATYLGDAFAPLQRWVKEMDYPVQ